MGLLDKLKGHKKEPSTKSFDDVAGQNKKRSSSIGRKSVEKSRSGTHGTHPDLPAQGVSGIPSQGGAPVASYPVEGATTVGQQQSGQRNQSSTTSGAYNHETTTTGTSGSRDHATTTSGNRASGAADNISTAAMKDGRTNEQGVDNLSRDLQSSSLQDRNPVAGSSYVPFSYDQKNLSQTPFNVNAFFESLGGSVGTTTSESVTRPAVIQETIHPSVREEIHPIFHREHHVIHHQTRIQPVLEQQFLPAKHYVLIDGQKHEITGEAIMNHVVTARDYIPMSGVAPKVIVHPYVDHEPLVGPVTGVGASLINQTVMLEHQKSINTSYENRNAGRTHDIPTGHITKVNYMPGQIPVSTVPGVGQSTLATSSVQASGATTGASSGYSHGQSNTGASGLSSGYSHGRSASGSSHAHDASMNGRERLPLDDAISRNAERLPEQRASLN